MADATYQPKTYRKQGGDEFVVANGGILNLEAGALFKRPIEVITGDTTLTAADSGKIIVVNGDDKVASLPATALGLMFTFIMQSVGGSTGFSISPVSDDKINFGTNNKDWINSTGTDVIGDSVTIVGDGADGWIITAMHGVWAAEG